MAWTQTDIDTLKAAIAAGVTTVKYGETLTTFRSLDEMRRILQMMENEVAGKRRKRRIMFQVSKGLC